MEENDFGYEPADIESIGDFQEQENNIQANIPNKKEEKSYDEKMNYDNEPRIYLTKDQPSNLNNDHINPQENTKKEYPDFNEEENKEPPQKKSQAYVFDIDDLLADNNAKKEDNITPTIIKQDNHIRVKSKDQSYNDANLFNEDIDDNDNDNNSKVNQNKGSGSNDLNIKKNNNYNPLFLTEKEPVFQPINKHKKNTEMNYDDLLNNNSFNKRKSNNQIDSFLNQKQEFPNDFPDYDGDNDNDIMELLDNDNNKEDIEEAVSIAKNNNQVLSKDNSIHKLEISNKENQNYQPLNYSYIRSSKVMLSHFEQAELSYVHLKTEIDKLLNTPIPKTNKNELSNQNIKMLHYLSSLNTIVKDLTDHTRVPMKKPQLPKKDNLGKTNVNNDKILERYKNEYIKLKTRLTQLSEPSYDTKVSEELSEIKTQIAYYEKENKQLKNTQRLSERILEKQSRGIDSTISKLKIIEMDYNTLKHQYETLQEKTEKNKQTVKENDIKLKELTEWKGRLEQQAKDMYGITEFEDVVKEEMIEKAKKEKITKLKKKIDVIDGSMESHKRKYEVEIGKNEKEIFQKEQDKLGLLKLLKEKTQEAEKLAEMIKAIYAPTLLSQMNERDEIANNIIKQENSLPILTPKRAVINDKSNQNHNSFNQNTTLNDNRSINREYQNIPIKRITQPEENLKIVNYQSQPELQRDEPEKMLLNNNLPSNRPIKIMRDQNQNENQSKAREKVQSDINNNKSREDLYLPIIEPKNDPKQYYYMDNIDNSKLISNAQNNNTNSNSRKPYFAFGFKKNEINNMSTNNSNNNNDGGTNNNNQTQKRYQKDNQPKDREDNIEEIIIQNEQDIERDYHESDNQIKANILRKEEQTKRNNEEITNQRLLYDDTISRQRDQYTNKNREDNERNQNSNRQLIKSPIALHAKEPSFLNDNSINKNEETNIQIQPHAKKIIPIFLEDEINERPDSTSDLFKHDNQTNHIKDNTNTNRRGHTNSNTNIKPKEEENRIKDEEELKSKPMLQSNMNDYIPERKKIEKTNEEKESEEVYNQLFNAKSIANANKKTKEYDPFDDFADLEEMEL